MRKFKVGDRVRIVHAVRSPERVGTETEVVALERAQEWWEAVVCGDIQLGEEVCMLDIPVEPKYSGYAAPHAWLEPVYDGNSLVSWSECLWQPRSVKVDLSGAKLAIEAKENSRRAVEAYRLAYEAASRNRA